MILQVDGLAGLEQLARYAIGVRKKLNEHAPLQRKWGPKLVQWQQENILRGTTPQGEAFTPLSPRYVKQREKRALSPKRRTIGRTGHPFGDRPLIDTTAMFATMAWDAPGPHEVRGGATAVSKGGFPYPEAHQLGWGVIARPWSGLRAENFTEMEHDLVTFADGALRK